MVEQVFPLYIFYFQVAVAVIIMGGTLTQRNMSKQKSNTIASYWNEK